MVNFAKSAVFFSPNVKAECKSLLLANLGVAEMGIEGQYLGLPYLIGRNKQMLFNKIKDKILPNWGLLSSSLGTNPSYIWASLQQVRDLIRKGVRWKIGKGTEDAYRIQQPGFSVLYPSDVAVWRRLWKLNIAAKCKVFMWRALTNRLPVRTNLVMRKQLRAGNMSICIKNDVVWNEKKLSWRAVASRASSFLLQWGKARKLTDYQQLRRHFAGGDCLWQKPAIGKYKLNVDASSSAERGKS
ncbi:conserved hypothetical protein [Ricinus communis]|uniref:Reverse transcriptase zinc-binding domain-containing protein n=1 Tax=Ricinus communis TaxID=3988 RepID=B9RP97_RICCO|nr:conserved hypothetical protein [Ricinus communis]